MSAFQIEDGDTVKHATINGGKPMLVVDQVDNGIAKCQLADGSTELIPVEQLESVEKVKGGFVNLDSSEDTASALRNNR